MTAHGPGSCRTAAPACGGGSVELVLNDQGGGFVDVGDGDVAPTCRRETRHHEAVMLMKEKTGTFENHQSDSRVRETEVAATIGAEQNTGLANNNPLVQYRYAVRRITPVEGERLQGFADNWTRPCFRPEDVTDGLCDRFAEIHRNWAEINGKPGAKRKTREQVRKWLLEISSEACPDGPRYKAIGNSMSVNVMRWIGLRIEQCERQSRADD